ncbi:MAG: sugar phosphate isomerase/epimerase [Candidatus Solibacter usitatus]|nr:sugar phosphate isomerase/epimerase [Candidatus Solibacter usitatus]
MNRRAFLHSSLAAAAPVPPPGRPRIGCGSFCFHSFGPQATPDDAIDIIGRMGFEGIELIILSRESIAAYWTSAKISELKRKLDSYRLQVSQFILFQPVVEGLTSLNRAERDRNLDLFETGCRIGSQFGAPIINIVAPWPRELKGPVDYLPRYYDIDNPKPGEKFHIGIAPGFDWDAVWAAYVDTTKACLQRAKAHRMKMTIEHHTHTMIPGVDAFLRLWDAVRDPDLGYNLDTGWTAAHRDYPPEAIFKVRRQLMNLHVRDIDGHMRSFPHIGQGVMDFKAICDALKATGFRGFLTLEQDKHPGDMQATARRYLAMMKEFLA